MKRLSGADQAEYGRLLQEVARLESVLAGGELSSMTKTALLGFVADAKGRIEGLEAKERDLESAETQRSNHDQAYAMAERETALNAAERAQFCNFMEQDHFTRRDFGALDSFYQHSWGRLTDGGKDQMSYRLWEGVRQHEYRFSEIPEVIKEKQAAFLETKLKMPGVASTSLSEIPAQDRDDFLQARLDGKREDSYRIMDRPTFAPHVAVSPTGDAAKGAARSAQQADDKAAAISGEPALEQAAVHESMNSKKITLPSIQDIDAVAPSLQPPLPERAGSVGKVRQ